jgi:hypothetical protein
LPQWIEKDNLELFLSLICGGNKAKLDLESSRKVIDIAVYFKAYNLIKSIICDSIIPNLDKHTCLKIIKNYIKFIYDDNSSIKGLFVNLVLYTFEIASKNIYYLLNNSPDELFSISDDSLEEIIERYLESCMFQQNLDHSLIMRLMLKNRGLNNIFDLLEHERKRALLIFDKLYQDGLEPTIIWKIVSEDPFNGYYKESEEFQFGSINLVLINYYDANKDIFNLAIRLKEDIQNSSQHIISILSLCEIKEIGFKSKINFNCIFTNTNTKVLVFKIEFFSKMFKKFENLEYSLIVYFNISFNFSAILTHVCKNFYEFHSLSSIAKIPKNVLNIILKNNILNVRSEDEVLLAIITWSKN